jgi:hypothetical protein
MIGVGLAAAALSYARLSTQARVSLLELAEVVSRGQTRYGPVRAMLPSDAPKQFIPPNRKRQTAGKAARRTQL